MIVGVLAVPHASPRYKVLRPLGAGGMGAIDVVWDHELQREVARKYLRLTPTEELRARLGREARVLATLRAPQIPEVYDFDLEETPPWITMELIHGTDLQSAPPEDPIGTYLEVAEGLTVLHEAGVIHRDVKPANIMVMPEGRVVLVDFGLAQNPSAPSITAEGILVGTPAFMAPEILQGLDATPASDLYAWGVSLFLALEGRLPFPYDKGSLPIPSARNGPPEFRVLGPDEPVRTLLVRCLAADPARRPTDIAELRSLLQAPPPGSTATPRQEVQTTKVAARSVDPPRSVPVSAAPPSNRRAAPALRILGGLCLAGGALLAWNTGTSRAPIPPASPPSAAGPPWSEATVPALPPDLLDLAQELRTETTSTGSRFLESYRTRGVGAYDRLPGQLAWMKWLAAGGRIETLSSDALNRLSAADETARELDLIEPFGPGWRPTPPLASGGNLESSLHETFSLVAATKRELEMRAAEHPLDFPGVTAAANSLLAPKLQLAWILRSSRRSSPSPMELDRFLDRPRQVWLRLATQGVRSLDQKSAGQRRALLERLTLSVELLRFAMFGSVSGSSAPRLLGTMPRSPEGRFFALTVQDLLAELATEGDLRAARGPGERARDWDHLASDSEVPDNLRVQAWIKGLRLARDLGDDTLFATMDRPERADLERGADEHDLAWLREARAWNRDSERYR